MFFVNYYNSVTGRIERVYFSRFEDVLTFVKTRYNVFDLEEHYLKIGFDKEGYKS